MKQSLVLVRGLLINWRIAAIESTVMFNAKIFEDISQKFADLAAQSPLQDLEKNSRALLMQAFSKLDLVTREEFDVQQQLLIRTREKLSELEAKVAELEKRQGDA